jgi:HSP20 family molecular chaperone IbpA
MQLQRFQGRARDLQAKTAKENIVTRIPVEKAQGVDAAFAAAEEFAGQIRQLAYHLFESRGGGDGRDLDDWLDAERELILASESKLVERDGKFEIRMPAQGYEAREIRLTASPASLAVRASNSKTGHKILLGTIDLPEPIDVDSATARLDNGVLHVTAVRKSREREPVAV